MIVPKSFHDQVSLKFRLYSGLFFDLPYDYVQLSGATLPLFTQYCREELSRGARPDTIVQTFFENRLGVKDFSVIKDSLFSFVRLVERQIVLFDAVEDAGFIETRDTEGVGSLHDCATQIESQGLVAQTTELLKDLGVRIVLTAHPTQFYTEAVLSIIGELREAIRRDDVHEVNRLLLQLGRTRFKKKEKPTPFDEAKAILWFMENVLYEVVPGVHGKLLASSSLSDVQRLVRKPLMELGFWPGGDRDGNPNVTAEVSYQVAELLGHSILGLYRKDLESLQRRLTFSGIMERLEAIGTRLERTQSASHTAATIHKTTIPGAYRDASQLVEDLMETRVHLVETHQGLFHEDLDRLITKVSCFGFHFGVLDLRQDSRILAQAVDQVLLALEIPGEKLYSQLNQEQRLALLNRIPETSYAGRSELVLKTMNDPVLKDCLEVFQTALAIQKHNGIQSVHRFIVSNTQGPADLLSVRFLALCAGMDPLNLPLDLVPLFETVPDLAEATTTMTRLWENPVYSRHLESRSFKQHIMLGFSDGTKDGGYLSANWGIYRAKQNLTSLAEKKSIRLVFFDGRGGPPARGGGNTHKFYRSLGRDIEGRNIHLTIQGQTISSNYGNKNSATYNLEQLASAALDNYLYPQNEDWHLNTSEAALLDELSDISHRSYRALRDHPEFLPYLETLSPLRYYTQANNSSRPAKRPGKGSLTLGDLRAIPFVGAFSQMKLNIPGYFGLGKALETLTLAGRVEELKELYRNSLYFRTLLENSMQSLSKVHLPLTSWIAQDQRFGPLHIQIVEEAQRTVKMLLEVSGQDELLAQDPLNRASIRMREDLIIPLSVVQQFALIHLRRLREEEDNPGVKSLLSSPETQGLPKGENRQDLEKLIVKSMAACVNASRNSV